MRSSEKKHIDANVDEVIVRYKALMELGRIINSSTHYEKIERDASEQIKIILNCEYVVLYRVDRKTNELYLDYTCSEEDKEHRVAINEHSIPGACAHYMAILHIKDVKSDIRHRRSSSLKSGIDYRDMLLAPMVFNGRILGVIKAVNSKHGTFNSEDIEFMEAVSFQMTTVVHNEILYHRLKDQFYQVCEALLEVLEQRDEYTGGHAKRVMRMSLNIGGALNLSKRDMDDLRLSALLHDIGKVGIEDRILNKNAVLNDEEFAIMKDHPRVGYEIMAHIDSLSRVMDGMRYHHERADGNGYPYKLKGEDIPLFARIISVADTYDALVSDRPYRKGKDPMDAYNEIRRCVNTQFDSDVVDAFVSYFKRTRMYRLADDRYRFIEKKAA